MGGTHTSGRQKYSVRVLVWSWNDSLPNLSTASANTQGPRDSSSAAQRTQFPSVSNSIGMGWHEAEEQIHVSNLQHLNRVMHVFGTMLVPSNTSSNTVQYSGIFPVFMRSLKSKGGVPRNTSVAHFWSLRIACCWSQTGQMQMQIKLMSTWSWFGVWFACIQCTVAGYLVWFGNGNGSASATATCLS